MMKRKSFNIVICAVFSALSLVLIYAAAILPTGQLGFLGLASLVGIAAVIEAGLKGGISVYVVSSTLGIILVSNKTAVLIYMLFFGYYPVLKLLSEKAKKRILEYIIKFAVFNLAAFIIVFILSVTFFNMDFVKSSYVVLFVILNLIFLLFDIGCTQAVGFYIRRVLPKIKRR